MLRRRRGSPGLEPDAVAAIGLPVVLAMQHTLTINLKTAKARALKVPSGLLATADEHGERSWCRRGASLES